MDTRVPVQNYILLYLTGLPPCKLILNVRLLVFLRITYYIIINHHCQLQHSSKEMSVSFFRHFRKSPLDESIITYNAYYKNPEVLKASWVCSKRDVYLRLLRNTNIFCTDLTAAAIRHDEYNNIIICYAAACSDDVTRWSVFVSCSTSNQQITVCACDVIKLIFCKIKNESN